MKNKNRCNLLGHKWKPVYVKGKFSGISIKFIACFCCKCGKGKAELDNTLNLMNVELCTYSKKYFKPNT
jgi:hypothetical protein